MLTPAQVARVWFVSTRTVQRRIAAGELPALRLPGGHYRVYRQDAEALRDEEAGMAIDPVLREAARVLRVAASVLQDDDEDGGDPPFQQILRSPKELRDPDLSRTKRLDREQEPQGLDRHRRAEDVEPVEMRD